jgi:transposase
VVRDIRRATRERHSAGGETRIVLEGLRGEGSIAALCRREGIAEGLCHAWSKGFLGSAHCAERQAPAGRPAGDTARAAAAKGEAEALRQEARSREG